MKTLTIFRHAKSSWSEPGGADIERQLSNRGHEQLETISRWMKETGYGVDKILVSPAKRTLQTLAGVQQCLSESEYEVVEPLYESHIDTYLETIWQQSADRLMIIGHNPVCDELARYLAAPNSPAFEKLMQSHFGTATLAHFAFDGNDWSKLTARSCSLLEYVRPKQLEKQREL